MSSPPPVLPPSPPVPAFAPLAEPHPDHQSVGKSQPAITTRIPHLGHALLFLLIAALSVPVAALVTFAFTHTRSAAAAMADPRFGINANILAWILALAASYFAFAALWSRPFLTGLHWNARAASWRFLLLGLALGPMSEGISNLLPQTPDQPIDKLAANPALAVILPVFGVLVAPLFEEVFFRGLLLPGLAIAVDYLRLPRSIDALDEWRQSESFSTLAMVAASIVSSLLFGLIHGWQLGFNWPQVGIIAMVGLALCAVRLRTRSLAASTLVHASYNLSIFVLLAVSTHRAHQP